MLQLICMSIAVTVCHRFAVMLCSDAFDIMRFQVHEHCDEMQSATACPIVVALTLCGVPGCLMHLLLTARRSWSVPTSQSMVLQQASSARMLTRSTPSAGVSSVCVIVCACSSLVCVFSKGVDTINALSRCFICPSVPPPDCVCIHLSCVHLWQGP